LRVRYPTRVAIAVMKSPPRPITRDMIVSEDMTSPSKFKGQDSTSGMVKRVVLVFLFAGEVMAKYLQDEVIWSRKTVGMRF
jgi:hypothetical protein